MLISDRTPFRGLEQRKAGWDISLDTPESFAVALAQLSGFDEARRHNMRIAARRLAEDAVANDDAVTRNKTMLEAALKGAATTDASGPRRA